MACSKSSRQGWRRATSANVRSSAAGPYGPETANPSRARFAAKSGPLARIALRKSANNLTVDKSLLPIVGWRRQAILNVRKPPGEVPSTATSSTAENAPCCNRTVEGVNSSPSPSTGSAKSRRARAQAAYSISRWTPPPPVAYGLLPVPCKSAIIGSCLQAAKDVGRIRLP